MRTVAFTRPADKIEDSLELASTLGLKAYAAPSLEILDGSDEEYEKAEGLLSSGTVDHVVFGSGTAIEKCVERYGNKRFSELFDHSTIIAIGPHTADVLKNIGHLDHDIMPIDDHSSYGIVRTLGKDVEGKTVLLVRSDSGSDILLEGLRNNGANVIDFASYRLKKVGMTDELAHIMDGLRDGSIETMAFTSPMSAVSFFELLNERYGKDVSEKVIQKIKVAAIGRPTALKLTSLGRVPDIVPDKTTFKDMLIAIRDL